MGLLYILIAFGGLGGALGFLALDIYAWYTGPAWHGFALTTLRQVLPPSAEAYLAASPRLARDLLPFLQVLPLSPLLLAFAFVLWELGGHAAEQSRRDRQSWHRYLSRDSR